MAVPIAVTGDPSSPLTYTVPGSTAFIPRAASSTFDGSGAAGAFLPVMRWVAQSGELIGRYAAPEVAAGAASEVSWFPWRRLRTPCPPCTFGITNCGGTGAGPIASDVGTTTLTLTLTRGVACAGTLHVVAAGVTIGSAFPDVTSVVNSVTDSHGYAYDFFDNDAAQIGPVGQQSDSSNDRLILGPTAVRGCGVGDMSAGDTITVGFHSDYPANFHSVGMACVLENTLPPAIANSFSNNIQYDYSDSYNAIGTTPDRLSWGDDGYPEGAVATAGMIAANAAYPAVGGCSPIEGTLVGAIDGACSLGFSFVDHVVAGDLHDPGADWGGNAGALAGNFQFITLTGA